MDKIKKQTKDQRIKELEDQLIRARSSRDSYMNENVILRKERNAYLDKLVLLNQKYARLHWRNDALQGAMTTLYWQYKKLNDEKNHKIIEDHWRTSGSKDKIVIDPDMLAIAD